VLLSGLMFLPRVAFATLAVAATVVPAGQAVDRKSPAVPHVISAEVPQYPRAAAEVGDGGSLILAVETDGNRVMQVSLAKAAGVPAALREAALANVRSWKFTPHEPASFETTFRYSMVDRSCDQLGRDTHDAAVLHFPTSIEVFAERDPSCPGATRLPPVFGIYIRSALVPVFPAAALAQGIDGDVTIGMTYKSVLSVVDAPKALGEPLMDSIRDNWQFNPGPYAEEMHFKFKLEDGECRGGPEVHVGPGLTSYEIKDRRSCSLAAGK
jgi:hypothetical protein